jgi:hypothetical protein
VLTPERLAAAPEPLLRALFERFQLQVRYHCEGHGAWVFQAEDALGKASRAGLTLAPLAVCALRLIRRPCSWASSRRLRLACVT